MNDEKAVTRPHPIVQFKHDMDAMVLKELDTLDDRAKSRMKSAALVAVTKDPDLLLADRQSFMAAIRMCANHGVLPDGIEATLQVYNTKVKDAAGNEKWVKKVTYLPMIRGIINRVQGSGHYKLFWSDVVYSGEAFRIDRSTGERRPVHEIESEFSRGDDADIVGAYSVAISKDGVIDCEAMSLKEIGKVRAVAKTKNVWDGWFSEKARVAVMKRHAKRLMLTAHDLEFILNREETDFDLKDVTPENQKPRQNLAQRLAKRDEIDQRPVVEPEDVSQDPEDKQSDEPDEHWTDTIDTSDAFPGSDEFTEGVKAQHAGLPRTACPNRTDEKKAADWLGGWDQAKEAAE